jgi:ABC-2 type transport system permease protein
MKAFLHHLAYDFKTGIRDRTHLLMNYLFPLAFFLLVSALMVKINPGFSELMLPAMTLFAIMASALLGLPGTLVNSRESGVFRSFRINGVPTGAVLAIPPLGGLVHMAVVALVVAELGPRLFGGSGPVHPAGYAVAVLLSYLAIAGIGALVGVSAANNRATILIGQFIYLPSLLLGGLMVPQSALPGPLARIALLLPTTHAMRVFSALGMQAGAREVPWISLGVLASGAVLSFALSAWLFQWDSRASQPNRRAALAILGLLPYAAAVLLG